MYTPDTHTHTLCTNKSHSGQHRPGLTQHHTLYHSHHQADMHSLTSSHTQIPWEPTTLAQNCSHKHSAAHPSGELMLILVVKLQRDGQDTFTLAAPGHTPHHLDLLHQSAATAPRGRPALQCRAHTGKAMQQEDMRLCVALLLNCCCYATGPLRSQPSSMQDTGSCRGNQGVRCDSSPHKLQDTCLFLAGTTTAAAPAQLSQNHHLSTTLRDQNPTCQPPSHKHHHVHHHNQPPTTPHTFPGSLSATAPQAAPHDGQACTGLVAAAHSSSRQLSGQPGNQMQAYSHCHQACKHTAQNGPLDTMLYNCCYLTGPKPWCSIYSCSHKPPTHTTQTTQQLSMRITQGMPLHVRPTTCHAPLSGQHQRSVPYVLCSTGACRGRKAWHSTVVMIAPCYTSGVGKCQQFTARGLTSCALGCQQHNAQRGHVACTHTLCASAAHCSCTNTLKPGTSRDALPLADHQPTA